MAKEEFSDLYRQTKITSVQPAMGIVQVLDPFGTPNHSDLLINEVIDCGYPLEVGTVIWVARNKDIPYPKEIVSKQDIEIIKNRF